jgi:hypothetical protein
MANYRQMKAFRADADTAVTGAVILSQCLVNGNT